MEIRRKEKEDRKAKNKLLCGEEGTKKGDRQGKEQKQLTEKLCEAVKQKNGEQLKRRIGRGKRKK